MPLRHLNGSYTTHRNKQNKTKQKSTSEEWGKCEVTANAMIKPT